MQYVIIRTVLSGIVESIFIITIIQILDLRSNTLFCALRFVELVVKTFLQQFGLLTVAGRMALATFGDIGLPILMSTGSLRTRATRVSIVWLGMMLAELVGTSIYTFVTTGSSMPSVIRDDNITDIVLVYLILIMVAIVINRLIVVVLTNVDASRTFFGIPTIGLLLSTFLPLMVMYARYAHSGDIGLQQTIYLVLYCWLALVGSAVVIAVARREAASQREAAEAALTARRVRHTRGEVEALAHRAEGMGSLRHALANDARAVRRLAGAGDVAGADRRLRELQGQARVLNGERDG